MKPRSPLSPRTPCCAAGRRWPGGTCRRRARTTLTLLALFGLGLGACHQSGPAGGEPADGGEADLALPERIALPATEASLTRPGFSVDLAGRGSKGLGAIALPGGAGTIEVRGEILPAVVYERQPYGSTGFTLFQTLVVAPDRWFLVWLYCHMGALTDVYFEGTDGTRMSHELASGSCDEGPGPSSSQLSFPAVELPRPTLVTDYLINGEDVRVGGQEPGALRIGARTLAVLPFEVVDCRQGCGGAGWIELHSLLWDPLEPLACFSIFYLFPDGSVQAAYGLSLPTLTDPVGQATIAGSWSGPPG